MADAQETRSKEGTWVGGLTLALLVVLSLYVFWLIFFYQYHFLDGVNLLIHEAGHVIFSPLGVIPGVLGGTIVQLFFPVAFAMYFARRKQPIEAGVCTIWSAESLMYTAEYLGDANRQELPLIGGHIHDWQFLLERAGTLGVAEATAVALHYAAGLVALLALFSMFRRVVRARS